jgi:hypothetical protein
VAPVVHVALEVALAAVAAAAEVVAAALVEDLGLDDGRVDAILDHQDLVDQEVQSQDPSVGVHVVASVEVDLVAARRLSVDKDLCNHQTVAAGAVAAELGVDAVDVADADAAGAVGVAGADDVAVELVAVQQLNLHAATCIEHELQQHDGVLQLVLLLHELYLLLPWPYDAPTIQPYSSIASHYEESCAWDRSAVHLPWAARGMSYPLIQV